MKDMFYNYDHNVSTQPKGERPPKDPRSPKPGCNEVLVLDNIKGEKLGVKIKQNSKVTLYFAIKSDKNLVAALSPEDVYFDILDFGYNVIDSLPVTIANDHAAVELISSEEGPVKYGTYKMHLYFILNEVKYTIFAPNDGVLSVE